MGRETPARRVHVPDLLLVLATLLVAALLIFQCADIYFTGTAPENVIGSGVYVNPVYSREIVGERLSRISWAFWVWLAALAATIVRRIAKPDNKKETFSAPLDYRLAILRERVEETPLMKEEAKKRRQLHLLFLFPCLLYTIMILHYALSPGRFASRDLEAVMGALLVNTLPWIVLGLATLLVADVVSAQCMEREIAAAKTAPKRKPEPRTARKSTVVTFMRFAVLAAAAALIAAGIANGGTRDVLIKAINICTECIGLG